MPLGLHRLMQAMNALGTLWILALMVLINSDVIGRNLFGAPILGVPEMTSLSIVGIVFLQLADTLRCGRFTRADILLDSLKRRRPAAADLLQAVFHAIGALLMAAILWAAWAPLGSVRSTPESASASGPQASSNPSGAVLAKSIRATLAPCPAAARATAAPRIPNAPVTATMRGWLKSVPKAVRLPSPARGEGSQGA